MKYYFSHCQNIILNIYWHYLDCVTQSIEGRCSKIGNRCWCLHKRGTPGSSVCGYASGYNGEYYSIDSNDDYPSALTIIQTFGMQPTDNCKDNNRCEGFTDRNRCNEYGCTGTSKSNRYSENYRWRDTNGDGFVRCTNMEEWNWNTLRSKRFLCVFSITCPL